MGTVNSITWGACGGFGKSQFPCDKPWGAGRGPTVEGDAHGPSLPAELVVDLGNQRDSL